MLYLKGTLSIGLWYPKCSTFGLKGYSDSDYVGCNMDRKITLGTCQLLGGKLMCWSAKKEQSVAMSLAETEYIAAAGAFTRYPNQYKEYLSELWYTAKALKNSKVWFSTPIRGILGKVRVNTFRNAIGAHYLSHSTEYVATPPLETIRAWFSTIGYSEEIRAKGTLRKSCLPPRSTLDINPSQPPASTLVVVGLHKEDHQATSGPTSLGVTSEGGANPQLSSAKSKVGADSGLSAPKDSISQTTRNDEGPNKLSPDHISAGVNFIDLDSQADDHILFINESEGEKEDEEIHATKHTETEATLAFQPPSSRKLEFEKNKAEDEVALLSAQPSFPNVAQLTELPIKSLKPKFSKILSARDFSNSLPTKLKELPSKLNELTDISKKEIKLEDLSKLVQNVDTDFMDMDSPEDDEPIIVQDESDEEAHAKKVQTEEPKVTKYALASIPPSSKTVQIQELSTQLLVLQTLNSKVVREKEATETKAAWFKTQPLYPNVEQLSQLLAIESASKKVKDHGVPSVGQASTHPAEGEKNTQHITIS
ncbi:hypothetical protein Tco_1576066 [Tanacetum coccineum]